MLHLVSCKPTWPLICIIYIIHTNFTPKGVMQQLKSKLKQILLVYLCFLDTIWEHFPLLPSSLRADTALLSSDFLKFALPVLKCIHSVRLLYFFCFSVTKVQIYILYHACLKQRRKIQATTASTANLLR